MRSVGTGLIAPRAGVLGLPVRRSTGAALGFLIAAGGTAGAGFFLDIPAFGAGFAVFFFAVNVGVVSKVTGFHRGVSANGAGSLVSEGIVHMGVISKGAALRNGIAAPGTLLGMGQGIAVGGESSKRAVLRLQILTVDTFFGMGICENNVGIGGKFACNGRLIPPMPPIQWLKLRQ